jgi:uncharacterized protein (DUF1778 family)
VDEVLRPPYHANTRALLAREQTIALTVSDARRFFAALERPPAPNPALRKAARAHELSGLHDRD